MSTQQKWWDDQQYLQKIGMQSQPDHMYDATCFAHQNMYLQMDNAYLEQRMMTAQDVLEEFEYQRKRAPEYVNPGPTNQDLRHPAVRNAWEEFQVIYRLSIGDRK